MAERRMVSLKVIDTDKFLDMPLSTRYLYHEMNARADDDGFIGSPKKIAKMVGGSDDDLRLLAAKEFIIPFQSGVIVIKHWRVNNYIRPDRYNPTIYADEKQTLSLDKSGTYSLSGMSVGIPDGNQSVGTMDTQVRLGKVRVGKVRVGKPTSTEPETVSAPIFAMPLNDGTDYLITQVQIDDWTTLYPAVDVMQDLRSMLGWIKANPSRRKTKRGILRFITGWLSKTQDKGGNRHGKAESECIADKPKLNVTRL